MYLLFNILIKFNIYFGAMTTVVLKRQFRMQRTAREY